MSELESGELKVCPACKDHDKYRITANFSLVCKKCGFNLGNVAPQYLKAAQSHKDLSRIGTFEKTLTGRTVTKEALVKNIIANLEVCEEEHVLEAKRIVARLAVTEADAIETIEAVVNANYWSLAEVKSSLLKLSTPDLCEFVLQCDPAVQPYSVLPISDVLLYRTKPHGIRMNNEYIETWLCAKNIDVPNLVDRHTVTATALMGVRFHDVTDKQRLFAKTESIRAIYSPENRLSLIVEPTNCRVCTDNLKHEDDGHNICRFCDTGYTQVDDSNCVTANG